MAFYKCQKGSSVELVPWSTGTVEQIKAILDAYYAGDISRDDIMDVWSIGDARTVSLPAIAAESPLTDTHVAQNVEFVLMNPGGKELVTPINGITECAFIVGQKDILRDISKAIYAQQETGQMHSAKYVDWSECDRRTWCNSAYKQSIPQSFRNLFKEVKNKTAVFNSWNSLKIVETNDYFAIPSARELTGKSDNLYAQEGVWFEYFQEAANRQLLSGQHWVRSQVYSGSQAYTNYYYYSSSNDNIYSGSNSEATGYYSIRPFGCI